jgi:hypothetical protein
MIAKSSHRILLTIATLVVGAAVLIGVMAVPSFRGIVELSHTIETERIKTEQTINRALKLRQNIEDIEKTEKALPGIEAMLVNPGEEIELFTFLEEKIRANSLTEVLRLGNLDKGVLPIIIDLEGSFIDVLRFMTTVERYPLLIPFTTGSMRLLPAGDTSEFAANLTGKVYVAE